MREVSHSLGMLVEPGRFTELSSDHPKQSGRHRITHLQAMSEQEKLSCNVITFTFKEFVNI